jgi:hypothetical protein
VLIEQEEKQISEVKGIGEQLDQKMLYFLCHKITSNEGEVSDLLILKNKPV